MKRLLVSVTVALGLVMALALPAFAAPPVHRPATVTVPSYINFTVTDNGAAGLSFGTLNPGTSDNPEQAQPGSSAVTLTVGAETNSNTSIQTKGDHFAIALSNGVATGGSSTTLVNTGAAFVVDGVAIGDTVYNRTDGSWATITAVTATTLTFTGGLAGGGVNTFTAGDDYSVTAASPSATIDISNAKWDIDSGVAGATAMATTYAQVGTSVKGTGTTVELYHWLTVPNGKDPGTYVGLFSYRAQ